MDDIDKTRRRDHWWFLAFRAARRRDSYHAKERTCDAAESKIPSRWTTLIGARGATPPCLRSERTQKSRGPKPAARRSAHIFALNKWASQARLKSVPHERRSLTRKEVIVT